MMPELNIEKRGFSEIKSVLSEARCKSLKLKIQLTIQKMANELNVTTEDYMQVANRWPLTQVFSDIELNTLINQIKPKASALIKPSLSYLKGMVIFKNKIVSHPTPFHQDISYQSTSRYDFATWVALDDATEKNGCLQFVPGSHKWPIEPAVDFWEPGYIDSKRTQYEQNKKITALAIKKGSAICFFSTIWHASLPNVNNKDRFAIVFRWQFSPKKRYKIPSAVNVKFGIFNAGNKTKHLLEEGLNAITNNTDTATPLVTRWLDALDNLIIPFTLNKPQVKIALKRYELLNKAESKFSAGDSQGMVFKELWLELLKHIEAYLEENTPSATESSL